MASSSYLRESDLRFIPIERETVRMPGKSARLARLRRRSRMQPMIGMRRRYNIQCYESVYHGSTIRERVGRAKLEIVRG